MKIKKQHTVICLFVCGLLFGSVAHAEVIAKCGPLKGYSYFYPGSFVSEEDAGWQTDGITNGSTTIIMVDGEIDILYGDDTGVSSTRATGGIITLLGMSSAIVVIGVEYPNKSFEVYTFNAEEQTLMFFQSKYGVAINKTTMIVSDCD